MITVPPRPLRRLSYRTRRTALLAVLLALPLVGCSDGSSSGGAPPQVAAIVPTGGSSIGVVPATIIGSGFSTKGAGDLTITFGGVAATGVTVLHDTTVSCVPPPGTPGALVDIVVFNAIGTSTLPNAYTYAPLPTCSGAGPATGTSLGGVEVTLTGTGFLDFLAGPNLVTFDGVPASRVSVVDDTTLTCDSPAARRA